MRLRLTGFRARTRRDAQAWLDGPYARERLRHTTRACTYFTLSKGTRPS